MLPDELDELPLSAAPAIAEPPRASAPKAAPPIAILRVLSNIVSPRDWDRTLGILRGEPWKALRAGWGFAESVQFVSPRLGLAAGGP